MAVQTVLVVEDDALLAKRIARMFEEQRALTRNDDSEVVETIRREKVDLVIVDLYLSSGPALHLVQRVRAEFPLVEIGVISGALTLELSCECIFAGADWYLEKPFDRATLLRTIERARSAMRRIVMPADLSLESAKRRQIELVMLLCDGNKSRAARELKVRRASLQRMLRDLAAKQSNPSR